MLAVAAPVAAGAGTGLAAALGAELADLPLCADASWRGAGAGLATTRLGFGLLMLMSGSAS